LHRITNRFQRFSFFRSDLNMLFAKVGTGFAVYPLLPGGFPNWHNQQPTINTMLKSQSKLACLAAVLATAAWFANPEALLAQDAAPAPEPVVATEVVVTETVVVETAAAPAEPTVEQRIADLEAYVNNGARTPDVASKIAGPGPGHNAWQMVSTALVLFMTLPGLALFYGGLVRSKNVLSILAMCLGIAGLVTIMWFLFGYSLTFSGGNAFIGDLAQACFNGMKPGNVGAGYYWISDYIWAMFQLTFAIITPALIFGATAERMKFSAVLLFTAIWMVVVYFPLAHMVWAVNGFMCGPLNADAGIKAIDFAGGTVVHMSSGWSALILCIILGPRLGFGKEPMPPHSMVLCMIGTGMLYVGWFGFNAGSALGADAIAANAFTTTFLCAATAGFVWAVAEWLFKGKPSVLGFCSGIVAGLVVITPAAGFVTPASAMIMAVLAGIVPFFAVVYMKKMIGYDDALDTFGVHGVGGTMGAILTGVFASPEANGVLTSMNLMDGLLMNQLKAVALTIVLSVVATTIIAFAIKFTIGLRPSPESESQGLDTTDHGEEGYIIER
jgi:Amt family ammonium transporter